MKNPIRVKRMLTIDEQLDSLRSRGIQLPKEDETFAGEYLANSSSFVHLTSYRVLFAKHQDGARKGLYVDLAFANLLELERLDSHLRQAFLGATLTIERSAKVKLLVRCSEQAGEDGYTIVRDFLASIPAGYRSSIERELSGRSGTGKGTCDPYAGALIDKYRGAMPIWVFVEVASFGVLLALYLFCAKRWNDRHMLDHHYVLKKVKSVRNACAHGSCIINGFRKEESSEVKTSRLVYAALGQAGIRKSGNRTAKMSNNRMQQLVTTLYCLSVVDGPAIAGDSHSELKSLATRLTDAAEHYGPEVKNGFVGYLSFLARAIDGLCPD